MPGEGGSSSDEVDYNYDPTLRKFYMAKVKDHSDDSSSDSSAEQSLES